MTYIIREDDISVLHFSSRTLNCLRRANIHTVGALLDFPIDDLPSIRNMGKKSIDEIQTLTTSISSGTGEWVLIEKKEDIPPAEFTVESVFQNDVGIVVSDIRIAELDLPIRASRCLANAGFTYASQLLDKTEKDLMRIQGMGPKSVQEILAKIESIRFKQTASTDIEISEQSSDDNTLAHEMAKFYKQPDSVWLREIISIKTQFVNLQGETLIYRLYESIFVRSAIKTAILDIIESNENEIAVVHLMAKMPPHLGNTTVVEEVLLELEEANLIECSELFIYKKFPSITEYASQIHDNRIRDILLRRLSGDTLNEIGDDLGGITRERVRQLSMKGLQNRPQVREDQYRYIYSNYDFSMEDFCLAYDEPKETYYYLEILYPHNRADRKSIEDILSDSTIPPAIRKKAEKAIYKKYITIDGVRVKKTRPDIVRFVVKNFCKALTKMEDFAELYQAKIDELGLGDDPLFIIDVPTYRNILMGCSYVLWNQGNSFRYYNIPGYDFEELISTLNLEQYENTVFSAMKLLRDYPEIMKQYDIRDEYELHNLLKKIWPTEKININFRRMPTIEVGTGSTDNQVLGLLLQYAPISAADLGEKYEEAYGVKASSAVGNLFKNFDKYFYNGIYSIDYAGLNAIQHQRMAVILHEDFYTINEVKRLYLREFPNNDPNLINPHSLKLLGFNVYPGYPGYIVKKSFNGASEYFNSILTSDDVVDMRNRISNYRYLKNYASELYKLRASYEIVEFAPLQYVNIRRLNSVGVTKDDLQDYCNAVYRSFEKGDYFTIKSLRNRGFTHLLDDLGFDEWFYGSVLFEDSKHFSCIRIGRTRIFVKGNIKVEFTAMLRQIMEQQQRMDVYDLENMLDSFYGIYMPKEKIIEFVHASDMYYDTIMEAVYIDYDTYFEEI